MTPTDEEIVYETKWSSINALFDTEAEAIADKVAFIEDALTRPSLYITASSVTQAGDDAWMCGNSKLTDHEILSGNFAGYYSVSSQYNSIASVGVEAEFDDTALQRQETNCLALVDHNVTLLVAVAAPVRWAVTIGSRSSH